MRPSYHLEAAQHHYPRMRSMVDVYRNERGKGLPDWPTWCFLPMSAWYAMVSDENKVSRLDLTLIPDVARLAAIGTWAYTKGVYRVENSLSATLRQEIVKGPIPCDRLYKMPEPCVYIETPGTDWMGSEMYGYWAHLEHDINSGRAELRLLLDTEASLTPLPIHLGAWTVTEAVDRASAEAARQAELHGMSFTAPMGATEDIAAKLNPMVSVLLYLCGDSINVEPVGKRQGSWPRRLRRTGVRGKEKILQAIDPAVWLVGQ